MRTRLWLVWLEFFLKKKIGILNKSSLVCLNKLSILVTKLHCWKSRDDFWGILQFYSSKTRPQIHQIISLEFDWLCAQAQAFWPGLGKRKKFSLVLQLVTEVCKLRLHSLELEKHRLKQESTLQHLASSQHGNVLERGLRWSPNFGTGNQHLALQNQVHFWTGQTFWKGPVGANSGSTYESTRACRLRTDRTVVMLLRPVKNQSTTRLDQFPRILPRSIIWRDNYHTYMMEDS